MKRIEVTFINGEELENEIFEERINKELLELQNEEEGIEIIDIKFSGSSALIIYKI